MIATIAAATILGARGHPVTVEVHVSNHGLPGFTMLGLPDESCREACDRVRAAVQSSGFKWLDKKVTVNLAPPHYRKAGSGLDVAIAIASLVAFEVIPADAVRGCRVRRRTGARRIDPQDPGCRSDGRGPARPRLGGAGRLGRRGEGCCPRPDPARRASRSTGRSAHGGRRLATVRRSADGVRRARACRSRRREGPAVGTSRARGGGRRRSPPLVRRAPWGGQDDVGSPHARPAARSGSRAGAPDDHGALGGRCRVLPNGGLITRPPFRSPHHTSSVGSLVGGGSHQMRPGEISLAHGGVLFLDEMGQFAPKVLDGLREALEEGQIMVGRVEQIRVPMPARFQLVGATNPCPCGGSGASSDCECDERSRNRYVGRLSGPLLDRFDLRVAVQRPAVTELLDGDPGESTADVAARVAQARRVAVERSGGLNAALDENALNEFAPLDIAANRLIRDEIELGRLTGRGYHRIRRVARTLADLAGSSRGRARRGLRRRGTEHASQGRAECARERGVSVGALAALAGLPSIGPQRLRLLLGHHEPDDALERLGRGAGLDPMFVRATPDELLDRLRAQAAVASPDLALAECDRCGVVVLARSDPRYPAQLAVDPEAPEVLFVRGDLSAIDTRRVGVIGTRHATAVRASDSNRTRRGARRVGCRCRLWAGAGHRRRGPPRRQGRSRVGQADRCCRQRPRRALSQTERGSLGVGRASRVC